MSISGISGIAPISLGQTPVHQARATQSDAAQLAGNGDRRRQQRRDGGGVAPDQGTSMNQSSAASSDGKVGLDTIA